MGEVWRSPERPAVPPFEKKVNCGAAEMAEQYFAQHDIQGLLDGIVKELAEKKPDDPKAFITEKLGATFRCIPCDEEPYYMEKGHPKWYNPALMPGHFLFARSLAQLLRRRPRRETRALRLQQSHRHEA